MTDISIVADRVTRATSLPTTGADVERVLSATASASELWQIVSLADRPFNMVVETVKQLEIQGLVNFDEGEIRLSTLGEEYCRERHITPRTLHRCTACEGRGVSLEAFGDALHRFEDLTRSRPEAKQDFDQAHVTPETTIARVALMADRGDLAHKDFLVLGDDDMMGLAAALTGLPRRVTVIETDERLVDFIDGMAKEEKLALDVIRHDLRQPLPANLLDQYDVFFTDPPDTLQALELFVSRGLASLRRDACAGYFGVTMVESSLRKWRDFQRILLEKYNVVVTDILCDFNTYVNWNYLMGSVRCDIEPLLVGPTRSWYKSSLFRIETLPDSLKANEVAMEDGLYTCRESLISTRGI